MSRNEPSVLWTRRDHGFVFFFFLIWHMIILILMSDFNRDLGVLCSIRFWPMFWHGGRSGEWLLTATAGLEVPALKSVSFGATLARRGIHSSMCPSGALSGLVALEGAAWPFGYTPGIYLGHVIALFLAVQETSSWFPQWLYQFHSYQQWARVPFLTFSWWLSMDIKCFQKDSVIYVSSFDNCQSSEVHWPIYWVTVLLFGAWGCFENLVLKFFF